MIRLSHSARVIGIATMLLALIAVPTRGTADSIQPLSPDESYYGMKLPEWAAAYYQWYVSIPKVSSPLQLDKLNLRAGVGQRGPVWFMPYVNTGEPRFTVPDGQAILVAISGEDWDYAPGEVSDDALLAHQSEFIDSFTRWDVSLDGAPVPDILHRYRVHTPVFGVTLPPGNIWDRPVTAGKDARRVMVVDGFFVLFPPLPVGDHVLAVAFERLDAASGKTEKAAGTIALHVQRMNEPLP